MRVINKMSGSMARLALAAMGIALVLGALSSCTQPAANPQAVFSAPERAVEAFVNANRNGDTAALNTILGPQAEKLVSSGDPVADKRGRERFLAAYNASHGLERESDSREILVVGKQHWPLPIPLIRENGGWRFDTHNGEQEILNRRIGHNELNVIEVCRAYVEAQREYSAEHKMGLSKYEYAQHFMSTPGKHDGLYWPVNGHEKESPLGPLIADARAEGYFSGFGDGEQKRQKFSPYHGYYFKILKSQGPYASGGTKDYVVNGHMTGGFALLAFPARYGDSGIMTFIVNQNGIVYEKDLGADTSGIASHITAFNPDGSWKIP